MTADEFNHAFSAMQLAISHPRNRKPKTFQIATEGYRKGALAKRNHIEELQGMTLEQLWDFAYSLRD